MGGNGIEIGIGWGVGVGMGLIVWREGRK